MSVLRNLESKIAGLVEGGFGRLFRTEVRPVEIARALVKEMDAHRTVSLSRTYVPNEYVVWLSPEDREKYNGVERDVADELVAYLLEHARSERIDVVSRPLIEFETDDVLGLGEFGIQARLVRAPEGAAAAAEPAAAQPVQAERGHTMVYSTAQRVQEPLAADRVDRARVHQRAFLVAEGKRIAVVGDVVVIGRSRECDVVLADANVSRRHAEIRTTGGGWTIADLGSTNGVRVNGRDVRGAEPITAGDAVEIGTVGARFEVA